MTTISFVSTPIFPTRSNRRCTFDRLGVNLSTKNVSKINHSRSFMTMTDTGFDYNEHPHRRFNPLLRRWLLVSPHRAKRPWQGSEETIGQDTRVEYDPNDYLGPGNYRVNGTKKNADYKTTYVFDNDFQALLPDTPRGGAETDDGDDDELFKASAVRGRCRVVCFSPKMNVTVAEMQTSDVVHVVNAWSEEYKMLSELDYINHIQIFENKGDMMGCSNPHPHGQIWASEFIPEEPNTTLKNLEAYSKKYNNEKHMLEEYIRREITEFKGIRTVCENNTFIAVVPFWAVWPFEILVVSKKRIPCILNFSEQQKYDLADIYRRVTTRYDNLFTTLFPYSMGIHQAPTNSNPVNHPYAHFHMHFYPPLLRSATIRKFMVGFELLGEAQRDLTAEQAAERLRNCSEVHFNHKK